MSTLLIVTSPEEGKAMASNTSAKLKDLVFETSAKRMTGYAEILFALKPNPAAKR